MTVASYGWECAQCGVAMAMTPETNLALRQSSHGFTCLYGHSNVYHQGKSAEQKLRDQLDAERRQRQRAEQKVAEVADEAKAAWATATKERHRANGYKGHATRISKRAKAGVCPCCNRTFVQLARHMQTQHPQFTPLEVIDGGKKDAA